MARSMTVKPARILKIVASVCVLCTFLLPTCLSESEFSEFPSLSSLSKGAGQMRRKTAEDVRARLLAKYDSKVSPTRTPGYPTVVKVSMTVNHFTLDELESTFYLNTWLHFEWEDRRLRWVDPTPADVRFSDTEIWKPDITVYNNAHPTDTSPYGSTLLVANNEGKVAWIFPAKLASICRLNMVRWPHDTHVCTIKLGSWSHDGFDVDLELGSTSTEHEDITFENWVENSEWTIIETNTTRNEMYYKCCPEPFVDVVFSFTIQRNSFSYTVCVILPIALIALLNVLVFLMPPSSGQKIILASTNFFIICIFLIYFEARLPSFSDHIPLVVLLYACNLVLVGNSLFISVLVISLSTTRRPFPPPQSIRKIFCNAQLVQGLGLGHLLSWNNGINGRGTESNDGDELLASGLIKPEKDHLCNFEWVLLASIIDRIAFIVYLVVSGIILGVCLA